MKKLVIITGPTASGKTARALEMAREHNGEIISADSRQVYKHLDVVTGKDFTEPNWQKQEVLKGQFDLGHYTIDGIAVWLYDVLDPKLFFSAFDWIECALRAIKLIEDKGKTPIIVGGTYFYIHSLLYGDLEVEVKPNWQVRQELELLSVNELQAKLKEKSEDRFNSLNHSDRNNKRRLIRWLEKEGLWVEKGKVGHREELLELRDNYQVELCGRRLADKEKLRARIKERIEERLKSGALEEVDLLMRMGYTQTDPGLATLGYQQIFAYLKTGQDLNFLKEAWLTKEMQYAKRQLTFMQRNLEINWTLL